MESTEYWIWLSSLEAAESRYIRKLLDIFGDKETLFRVSREDIAKTGVVKDRVLDSFMQSRSEEKIHRLYEVMCKDGIRCVSIDDGEYPQVLRTLDDPPFALYVKGRLPDPDEPLLSIVGARSCSVHGEQIAKDIAMSLGMEGIGVVSGMARGIDGAAHRGCLAGGGKTYAILGCGPDICYPPENIELYMKILENGGIISEYVPGSLPNKWHFPARNRLIAGLSKGVLVVEARKRSGSLITANLALDSGRDVYAVPGRPDDPLSAGCNKLIADGAILVMSARDILSVYGKDMPHRTGYDPEDGLLKTVYGAMSLVPQTADDITARCHLPVNDVMNALITLELTDRICRTGKGHYAIDL